MVQLGPVGHLFGLVLDALDTSADGILVANIPPCEVERGPGPMRVDGRRGRGGMPTGSVRARVEGGGEGGEEEDEAAEEDEAVEVLLTRDRSDAIRMRDGLHVIVKLIDQGDGRGDVELGDVLLRDAIEVHDEGAEAVAVGGDQQLLPALDLRVVSCHVK